MKRNYFARTAKFACIVGAVLLGRVLTTPAEQLPIRHYGIAEGLPNTSVVSIFQDSKGYLWFGTADGISRFDGYRFTTYDTGDGLINPFVNSITEDREGRIWIATNGGGVSCFVDGGPSILGHAPEGQPALAGRRKFVSFKLGEQVAANRVNSLIFDADGRLWCATDAGLYRAGAPRGPDIDVKFEVVVPHADVELPMAAFADSRGRLWFGIADSLIEIVGDRVITYGPGTELPNVVNSIAEDRQGRLLASNTHSLLEFVEPPDPASAGRWKRVSLDVSHYGNVHCLLVDREGRLWIGAMGGLIKYTNGEPTLYTTANGLSDNAVISLEEDRNHDLWIGTKRGVLCVTSRGGAVSFGKADGLPEDGPLWVFAGHSGRVYASIDGKGLFEVADRRVVPIQWSEAPPFNTINRRILQDRRGDWWVGTDKGLFRLRGPDLQNGRGRKPTAADGFSETFIASELYEDGQGKLWFFSHDSILYCLDPAAPAGQIVVCRVLLRSSFPSGVLRVKGDPTGALWVGAQTLLGRVVGGQARMLMPADGLPEADPRAFYVDSRGWLWIGLRYKGVSVTKDPGANPIKFANYSTEDGLANNTVWSITEDNSGHIYLGTGRGLDRLDPSSGRIQHIRAGEQLSSDSIETSIRDSRGYIWVATSSGLSRLAPDAEDAENRAPPVYLTRFQVGGIDLSLPDTGVVQAPSLSLSPSRNNVLIEYVGLDFRSDRELKYQYRLEGVDADWSAPTDQRSVNYASLAPGSYRFTVRAVNQEGIASLDPAVVQIRVLPPFWRRWWFIGLAVLLLLLTAYVSHRFRVSQLVGLERVRTRIAADLHDDIGSGLSKIAILSDVASHLLPRGDSEVKEPLSTIAATSRELVDSMSDIVWAINPNRDRLLDLIQRMRRFASDILSGRNIELSFNARGIEPSVRIGTDARRQILLIFKEGVNNIARHSECRRARVDLNIQDGRVLLELTDDGRGFDPATTGDGNGLASMRIRAASLDGHLEVTSAPGAGTAVRLKASLSAQLRQVDGRPR